MGRVKKIVHTKLGRQNSWGLADDDTIYIDTRCKGRKHMSIALHETLHVVFPTMSEKEVRMAGNELARVMWKLHYRRVENEKGQSLSE